MSNALHNEWKTGSTIKKLKKSFELKQTIQLKNPKKFISPIYLANQYFSYMMIIKEKDMEDGPTLSLTSNLKGKK